MVPCHAMSDDVGDHLMPEQSVLCSPDDLCRAVGLTLSSQHVDMLSRNFSLRCSLVLLPSSFSILQCNTVYSYTCIWRRDRRRRYGLFRSAPPYSFLLTPNDWLDHCYSHWNTATRLNRHSRCIMCLCFIVRLGL